MKNKLALIAFILTWMLVASPAMAVVPKVLSVDATGKQVTSDSAGRFIYIPDQKYNSLIIVDSSTLLVDDTISLPGAPQDIALDESAGKIYVTVSGFFEVLAFDISTYVPETSLSLPQAGNEIVVGHNYIYVTTLESGSGIMRVDKTTGNYVDSFSLGVSTYQRGAIEITPDKSKLIFANRGLSPGTVAVFDITGSDPVLLIKNEHGTLGGNGQGISVDPINGSFLSYAVGGGNGTGYGIAKLGIDDLSWFGELVTGPYPRAIHYSANGITAYTNNV
jgi:DNA-binding beta-propeller fold protein YncE